MRKLSTIEHMIEGNFCYFVGLEGSFGPDQLRSALARVQYKHPALRTLIREEPDGLYYEDDIAPPIPLRVVPRTSDDDYRREFQIELAAPFPHNLPQLRVAWLQSKRENDLLVTTSHRICDGMSLLTIIRELLRALYSDDELVPYAPVTTQNIIGDYQPARMWKRKLAARLVNTLLRLIPNSRGASENREHYLEWGVGQTLSGALKQRCKVEGVSVHAALLVALDRALLAVLGKKKLPEWIDSPMKARRGRRSALKNDMLFFGGGRLKIRTGQTPDEKFWAKARAINEEIRRQIKRETLDIPSRYHFCEMLRPPSSGTIQSLVRLGDALKMNGSWNHFALSNFGNVVLTDSDAPFRVKDLRPYVHSFSVRVLGLITLTLNGEMRFVYMGDEKCLGRGEADALKNEFMALLEHHTIEVEAVHSVPRELDAVAE